MPLTVIVCGGRDYNNRAAMRAALEALPSDTIVFHGAARGADTLADEVARELGLVVRRFPANWSRHGRSAGPIRNAEMLKELLTSPGEHAVLAAPGGKGTAHMCMIARRNGVAVIEFR